jgi:hypothetical protein
MDKSFSDKPKKCRVRVRVCLLLPVALLALVLSGCAATIIPPDPGVDSTPVYVLDHGRHNSLVLVVADDRVMRYALGEWDWYAERETGFGRSLQALFKPTPSALARARLLGPAEPDCWVVQVGSEIRRVYAFAAERQRVVRLADEIDAHFERPDARPEYRAELNLEFVPGPQPYTLGHNSNHQVAEWLAVLGFEVSGVVAFGRLRPLHAHSALSADSSACSAAIQSDSS